MAKCVTSLSLDPPPMRVGVMTLMIGWTLTGLAASAHAQSPPAHVFEIETVYIGDCHVTVDIPPRNVEADVEVQIDRHPISIQHVGTDATSIRLLLDGPLQPHDQIRTRIGGGTWVTVIAHPRAASVAPECSGPAPSALDPRGIFEATGYYGWAFDNFAPNRIGNYINQDQATSGVKSRWLAGTDVDYRLFGRNTSDVQVWFSAETMHGVRTGDIDCRKTQSPLCQTDNPNPSVQYLAVLQGASSLEVFFEPRLELYTIQRDSDFPVKFYVDGRLGFIDLDTGPRVFRDDHVGLGLLAVAGPFAGSSAEVGVGRTALIDSSPKWNRLKVDATLQFDLVPGWTQRLNVFKRMAGATRGFVELYIDKNPGTHAHAPDCVQTFVGMSFDFRTAFAK